MTVADGLAIALRALAANKLRSALTMLGMIIGVSAVVALMSIGRGAQASITNQIRSLGTNLLFVTPGALTQGGVRQAAGSAGTLTLEDAEALLDPVAAPAVAAVAPELTTFAQIVAGPANTNTRVVGVTPDYEQVRNLTVAAGDFITSSMVEGNSLTAVLGPTTAQDLFGDMDPIGQTIRIVRRGGDNTTGASIPFRVVGLLESKGAQSFGNQDDVVYIPITTMQTRLANQRRAAERQVSTIYVSAVDDQPATLQAAVEQIGAILRERHRVVEDDFTVRSQEETLQAATQITGVMTLLLGLIAGISLLVGGIGIMNIMLVSVTERTREIGIRKAVGARQQDVLTQFLLESIVVSVLGGAIGVGFGILLSFLAGRIPVGGQTLQTLVTPDAILLAFGVAFCIGMFFGLYPASRAARLHPIEALRYE